MESVRYPLRHDSSLASSRCESHSTPSSAAASTASCVIEGPTSGAPPDAPKDPIGDDVTPTPTYAAAADPRSSPARPARLDADGADDQTAVEEDSAAARRDDATLSASASAHNAGCRDEESSAASPSTATVAPSAGGATSVTDAADGRPAPVSAAAASAWPARSIVTMNAAPERERQPDHAPESMKPPSTVRFRLHASIVNDSSPSVQEAI